MLAASKLSLSESKTQLILFRCGRQHRPTASNIKLNNFIFEPVKSVTYLSIEVDEILSWNKQSKIYQNKNKWYIIKIPCFFPNINNLRVCSISLIY